MKKGKGEKNKRRRKDETYTPHLLSLWYLQIKVLIRDRDNRQAGRQVDVFHLMVINKEFLEFLVPTLM